MSIKAKRRKKAGVWLLPLMTAAPFTAAMLIAVFRFGPTLRKLLSILIKLVVTG